MRSLLAGLTLCLLMSAGLCADPEPKLVVTAVEAGQIDDAKAVPVGDQVMVTVSSDGAPPKNLQSVATVWDVEEYRAVNGEVIVSVRKFQSHDNSISFGTGTRTTKLNVTCTLTYLFVEKEGDSVKSASAKTYRVKRQVAIENPVQPAPPTPPPAPTPIFPAGKFGLAKQSFEIAQKVVPENVRKAGAKALASSFQSMSAKIAAGAVKEPEEILKQTFAANNAAIKDAGLDINSWDVYWDDLQTILYDLYKNKKTLKVPADYKAAWDEIATGLDAIK